jgi:Domain of unknown function (DUF4157)
MSKATHQAIASEKPSPKKAPIVSSRSSEHTFMPVVPLARPQAESKIGCPCGGGCPRCQPVDSDGHARRAGNNEPVELPSIVREVLRSPGQPLNVRMREFMEQRLGQDFGRVRIHLDGAADEAVRSVGAKAFTRGSQIVFGAGHYSPETAKGRWLLAHELAHVAQTHPGESSSSTADVERDASHAATAAMEGRRAHLRARHDGARLHLFGEPENVPEITYISTQGQQGFLQQALDFHQAWGLTIEQVSSVEQMVAHLAQATTHLNRIRFVTHAAQVGVFTSLFAGEPLESLRQDRVSAYAESDAAGLALDTQMSLNINLTPFVDEIRSSSPALLRPFGLEAAGDPTGQLEEYFRRVFQLEALTRTRTPQNASRFDPMIAALPTVISNVVPLVVQQFAPPPTPPPATGQPATPAPPPVPVVTSADVVALQPAIQAAITTLNFAFSGINVPASQAAHVREATRAIAAGFRGNLNAARSRFDADSWVDIRGCNAGNDINYLRAVSRFFGNAPALPHVSAPNWFQVFPFLRLHSFGSDASVNSAASNPSVTEALDRWSPMTGARQQMELLRTFYSLEVIRRQNLATQISGQGVPSGPFGTSPRLTISPMISLDPLAPGLPTTAADRTAVSLLRIPFFPPLNPPQLFQPAPRFTLPGNISLPDPGIAIAQGALNRLNAPNAELHYYLDSALVLPVFTGGDQQQFDMFVKTQLRDQAIDGWLSRTRGVTGVAVRRSRRASSSRAGRGASDYPGSGNGISARPQVLGAHQPDLA